MLLIFCCFHSFKVSKLFLFLLLQLCSCCSFSVAFMALESVNFSFFFFSSCVHVAHFLLLSRQTHVAVRVTAVALHGRLTSRWWTTTRRRSCTLKDHCAVNVASVSAVCRYVCVVAVTVIVRCFCHCLMVCLPGSGCLLLFAGISLWQSVRGLLLLFSYTSECLHYLCKKWRCRHPLAHRSHVFSRQMWL